MNIIHKSAFPIEFPYMPNLESDKILYARSEGDIITILYVLKPDGEKIDIHRSFRKTNGTYEEL